MFDNYSHENVPPQNPQRVFFKGTGAITAGYGVCGVRTHVTTATGETATDDWGKRCKIVDVPTKATNEFDFVGVVTQSHDANENGQWIDIVTPGSFAKIYVNEAVTIGDYVTCIVGGDDVGQWTKDPLCMLGIGTARILQTITEAGYALAELIWWGPQSGLLEDVTLAAAGGAHTFTLGGVSVINSGALAADATYTLADGKFVGQRKAFFLNVTATMNNNLVITLATTGEQLDGSTNLASIEMDGDNDYSILEWRGTYWQLIANSGSSLSAS